MSERYARILIVRLSHLGDVVHALPVFHALRSQHPEAEIGWAVQPEFAGLIEGMRGLSKVFRFDRRAGIAGWTRLLREIREWRPEWAVDAQGNAKSALATIGSGAGRRSGMHPSDWRERFAARVLTDSAPAVEKELPHAMDKMLTLARHVAPGIAKEAIGRRDADMTEVEEAAGRRVLAQWFPDEGMPAWILQAPAPGDVRSWPAANLEALARELDQSGSRVLVLSGPQEENEGREIQRRLHDRPGVQHWVGQRGLRELASFFTAAGPRGARLICCDSGPMHLATACGLAVVCLAGPQDERRTGPWPMNGRATPHVGHRVVRARIPPKCAPCSRRKCDHLDGPVCMSHITHADVISAGSSGLALAARR